MTITNFDGINKNTQSETKLIAKEKVQHKTNLMPQPCPIGSKETLIKVIKWGIDEFVLQVNKKY